ncbi:MAG: VanZ family protein [Gammaproteobacteria bacterium]|nr:VanZ family protein [Gammaproteobacteria bacterium]
MNSGINAQKRHYLRPLITLAYLALVVYGSLYPMSNWRLPENDDWWTLFDVTARYMPRSDYVTNFLVYMPLGVLIAISLRSRFPPVRLILVSVLLMSILSLTLEWLQIFLPRVPSLIDSGLNMAGGFIGTLIAYFTGRHSITGAWLREKRCNWFAHGRFADLALATLGIWALSVTSPLIPVSGLAELTDRLQLFSHTSHWLIYPNMAINVLAVGFILSFISVNFRSFWPLYIVFVFVILFLRLFVMDTQMDLAIWFMAIIGMLLCGGLLLLDIERQAAIVMTLLVVSYLMTHFLQPDYVSHGKLINWLPFDQQIGKIQRFAEILQVFFVFLSLSFCAIAFRPRNDFNFGMIGGFMVVFVVLLLESQDTVVDVTEILLALGAWTIPWLHPEIRKGPTLY